MALPAELLDALRALIQKGRQQALRAVDMVQVQTCWEIGHHIVEFEQGGEVRAAYGKKLLPQLATVLSREFGKGFDATNLRHMRGFYQAFPIRDALRRELSWTHYRLLLRVSSQEAQQWYMNEAALQNWSSRALDRQIAFVARQQRVSTEFQDFYIDLVFYNYLLKCFVLIDLKTGKLTHQDIGQMDMYVRMYDDLKRGPDENPTVGILLCDQKDQSVARYSVLKDSEQLFATKYRLVLPSEDDLRAEIERERTAIEAAQRLDEDK